MPPEPAARSSLPADLLLPLFTLTLLANAVLVAFAIRGMRSGSSGPGRSGGTGQPTASRPPTPALVTPDSSPPLGGPTASKARMEPAGGSVGEAGDAVPGQPTAASAGPAEAPSAAPAAAADPGTNGAIPAGGAAPAHRTPPASRRRGRATPSDAGPAEAGTDGAADEAADAVTDATGERLPSAPTEPPAPARAAARRRSRRRFSLPPLDEDHEKVNRSIKSFLAGADTPDAAGGGPPPEADGATTIALVALDSPSGGEPIGESGRTGSSRAGDEPTSEVSTMVERTLRAAARATDVVTVIGRGRFRITLRATGELAARAYLRRVRATVEPLLESADRPLRLAIATATALDEPLDVAIERAERRLAVALTSPAEDPVTLDGAAADVGRPERTPRAAAD